MRKRLFIILLSLSISGVANENASWTEMQDYTFHPGHELALKATKAWVKAQEKEKQSPTTIWHYEYKITTTKNGFHCLVVKYTLTGDNQKQYYPGAHFSLDIDHNGNVITVIPGI